MSNKIKVIAAKVNEKLEVVNDFENSLESLQKFVGGYIEVFSLVSNDKTGREIILYLNEEGKHNGSKENIMLVNSKTKRLLDIINGDVLITSSYEGETVSLNKEEIEFVMDAIKESKFEGIKKIDIEDKS